MTNEASNFESKDNKTQLELKLDIQGDSILGVGTDLTSVNRITQTWERFGERFVNHLLTPAEQLEWQSRNKIVNYLAKQWSAKEAIAKAFGSGISGQLGFQSIEILRDTNGKPFVNIQGESLINSSSLASLMPQADSTNPIQARVHISLTDEDDSVIAFAILSNSR